MVAGLFEITRANIPQIWTFINSKLKFNRMNGVEGKFKNRILCKMRKECGTLRRPGRSLTCEGAATLYDGVGSVKGHEECASRKRLVFSSPERNSSLSFISTKARS